MRFALTLLFLLLLLPALRAVAEGGEALPGEFEGCSPPESPAIPDGEKATTDEMKQAVSVAKAYLKQGEDYLACVIEVEKSWGDEATKNQKKELNRNHDAMVGAMEALAERCNAERAEHLAQKP